MNKDVYLHNYDSIKTPNIFKHLLLIQNIDFPFLTCKLVKNVNLQTLKEQKYLK